MKNKICIHQFGKTVYVTPTGLKEIRSLLTKFAEEFFTAIPEQTTVELELY